MDHIIDFVRAHEFGLINGAVYALTLGASHWLSVTDKVGAANFAELISAGVQTLLKKKPAFADVVPPVEEKKGK